jgi:protein-disulfide isomerase
MLNRASFLLPLVLAACQPTGTTPKSTTGSNTPQVTAPSAAPAAAPDASTVVASWKGGQLTYGDLAGKAKGALTKMEIDYLSKRYETLQHTIDTEVNQTLLDQEAKARGFKDADSFLAAEIDQKNDKVTDEEVQAFFKANEKRMGGKSLEEVRPKVEKSLLDSKKRDAYQALIDGLRTKADLKVQLAPPDLPKMDVSADDDPIRGNPNAPVTIIEFADFQCPYCAKVFPTLKELLGKYDGKVRLVYRDYTLPFHNRAMPVAIAANCAAKQGKFWEFHDLVYQNQDKLQDSDLAGFATQIGLDMGVWTACQKDPAITEEITKDMAAGQEAGVSGTPAFFVNGTLLSGAVPIERFDQAIQKELASAKK